MPDFEVVLPNMGFGMEEGKLLSWLKKPGDSVRKGEAIAEVESDKANVELEAVVDGILDSILIPADQVVPVGTVLARIRTGASSAAVAPPAVSAPATASASAESSDRGQKVSPVAQRLASEHGINLAFVKGTGTDGRITREDVQAVIDGAPTNGNHSGKVLTAPAVRKLARDNGIDLTTVRATGHEGRIRREDVEAILNAPLSAASLAAALPVAVQPAPASLSPSAIPAATQSAIPTDTSRPLGAPVSATLEGRREIPITPMRQAIARHLAQTAQAVPHFYTSAELDFTGAIAALPKGIGVNTLILYLTIQTLHAQPELNATYENGRLYQYDHVHLAVAVALPNGLIAPVLHRADDYSLAGLADRSRDLIERTRANKLKPDELGGGTFSVSNLGIVKQIDRFTALINAPQVAILAVGAAKPRPLVIDGGLHIRTTAHLTLSADHRIIDGMLAARFLEAFDAKLQGFRG
ncbi:MAG: dihydrolipoamide acetyltransferase family protein [Chloroflexota bacterium]